MQQFIQEISTLRSLAEAAGIAGLLLEELDVFKHEVEHLDSSVWERKEVRVLNRDELVRLSLAVLRAFGLIMTRYNGGVEYGGLTHQLFIHDRTHVL